MVYVNDASLSLPPSDAVHVCRGIDAGCNCHLCWTQFVDADPGVVTRGKTNVWRGINRARDKKKRKLGFASPVPKKDESEAADR